MNDRAEWVNFLANLHYQLTVLIRRTGPGALTDYAKYLCDKISDELEAIGCNRLDTSDDI